MQPSGTIGQFSLVLAPQAATRQSTLSLAVSGFDPSTATVEWLVNDRLFGVAATYQFNGADVRKGDVIKARAVIQGREIMSNAVEIRNAPPELTQVRLLPEVFRPGDTLSVEASASDPDDDKVTILYEWIKNGAPAGNGSAIEGQVRRSDKIILTVTPYDGESYGSPAVLNREIANLPPMFIEHKNFHFNGTVYSYQAKAADPDGDAVRFSLVSAPEGMHIDPSSGELVWNVPPAFQGTQDVTVVADDGHGGMSQYRLMISIQGR